MSKKLFLKILSFACVIFIGFGIVPMVYSQQAEGQVLRMAIKWEDINSLDPHRAVGSHDRVVVEMVFNGLLRYQPGNMSAEAIEPDLAKGMPASKILPDGRQQWVFNLRQGVLAHSYGDGKGYELTSEDVVYSFQKAADPKRSAFSGDYSGMTFEAIDRYTIRITVPKPVSPLLFLPKVSNRAGGLIVCKKPLEEKGEDWFKTHPVGTGPFKFEKYTPREKIVLIRNENYFRGRPNLSKVEVYYIPDLSVREMAIQKGELDVIYGEKDQAWVDKMEKVPGCVIEIMPSNSPMVLHFNMTKSPLNLLKVRQAMAYALGREKFITYWGKRMCTPVYSAVPLKFCAGGLTRDEVAQAEMLYDLDLPKAKKLLAESGYPNGFTLTVNASTNPAYMDAWTLIAEELKKIGIQVVLKPCDHPTYHTLIRQDLNPLVLYDGGRENADMVLAQYYHSDSIVATGKKPVTNFSHMGAVDADGDGKIDSIDDLITAARAEVDEKKQERLWKDAQIKLLKVLASYPLYHVNIALAKKPYVSWGYELKVIPDFPIANETTKILPH